MKEKNIQQLIDRYLAGDTTPEEESQLARELLGEDIPAEWKAVRTMLGELEMGAAEYDRILEERNAAAGAKQDPAASAEQKPQTRRPSARKRRLSLTVRWASVATSVLLLFGLFLKIDNKPAPKAPETAPPAETTSRKESPAGTVDPKEAVVAKTEDIQPAAPPVPSAASVAQPEKPIESAQEQRPAEKTDASSEEQLRESQAQSRNAQTQSNKPSAQSSELQNIVADPRAKYAAQALDGPDPPRIIYLMRTADNPEKIIGECERAILEDEFQEYEKRSQVVSI